MRLALLIALVPAAALAQTPELDRLRLQDLQRQNMAAQERTNEISRQAADLDQIRADLARAQADATLRALEQPAPAPPVLHNRLPDAQHPPSTGINPRSRAP
jgi:hypothetical protein